MAGYDPNSKNVLVLEDTEFFQSRLEGILKKHGFEPLIFANYIDCSRALKSDAYCAAILDVNVPRDSSSSILDEWGYVVALKILNRYENMPVLLYSSVDEVSADKILDAIQVRKILFVHKEHNIYPSEIDEFLVSLSKLKQ